MKVPGTCWGLSGTMNIPDFLKTPRVFRHFRKFLVNLPISIGLLRAL
jgi:hypothetical protein